MSLRSPVCSPASHLIPLLEPKNLPRRRFEKIVSKQSPLCHTKGLIGALFLILKASGEYQCVGMLKTDQAH